MPIENREGAKRFYKEHSSGRRLDQVIWMAASDTRDDPRPWDEQRRYPFGGNIVSICAPRSHSRHDALLPGGTMRPSGRRQRPAPAVHSDMAARFSFAVQP
jgi:hypothetical protein